ncbi:MAG: PadR family transcriptional regulator [Thermoleophilia bacterium]
MPRRRSDELSIGEWAILALLAERPSHGFALAQALAPSGSVGQVWTLPRPLVYRALEVLQARALIEQTRTEEGKGPKRTVFAVTPYGRNLVEAWLQAPVEHVRDARSLFMLKLLFLHRAKLDPQRLLHAQRARLERLERSFQERSRVTDGFDRTLALWRLESTRALVRFIDAMLAASPAEPPESVGSVPASSASDEDPLPQRYREAEIQGWRDASE